MRPLQGGMATSQLIGSDDSSMRNLHTERGGTVEDIVVIVGCIVSEQPSQRVTCFMSDCQVAHTCTKRLQLPDSDEH